jgi:hypothetical protein
MSSTTTRTIHARLRPRLESERKGQAHLLYENARVNQIRLVGGAGAVQVLFWANVADMWGRNMRDAAGELAPLWQRGSVVAVCALVAGAFTMLAWTFGRNHVAQLQHFPHSNEIQITTYSIFGQPRPLPRIPLSQVVLQDDAASRAGAVSFRAPRVRDRPLRVFDLSFKLDPRGQFHVPSDQIRSILRGQNSNLI